MTRAPRVSVVGLTLALLGACGGEAGTATTNAEPAAITTTMAVPTTALITTTGSPSTTANSTFARHEAGASDWASYGFDDGNSRHNRAETILGPENVSLLEVAWSIDDLGGVSSTPVVIDGLIHFADWSGRLHVVEAISGSTVWETQLGERAVTGTPLVTADQIFAGDADAWLYACDRSTGVLLWSVQLDEDPTASILAAPIEADGVVMVGLAGDTPWASMRGSVVGVEAATGAVLWRVDTTTEESGSGSGVWSAGAIDRDRGLAFFATGNTVGDSLSPRSNALLAIDYSTGEVVWAHQLTDNLRNEDIGTAPNLFEVDGREVVAVGTKEGRFWALDRATGEEIWSVRLTEGGDPGGVMTTAAVGDDAVYVNAIVPELGGGSITFALDKEDGSILWESPMTQAFGALTLANGLIIHGTIAGTIHALDAANGNELWSSKLPGNFGDGISVAGGTLFAAYGFNMLPTPVRDGGLLAYSLPE